MLLDSLALGLLLPQLLLQPLARGPLLLASLGLLFELGLIL